MKISFQCPYEQAKRLIRMAKHRVIQLYESVQNIDVHDFWFRMLSRALVVNPRAQDSKKRLYVFNTILCIWYFMQALRFASTFAVSDDDNAHLYGHTFARAGSVKLFALCTTIILVQCCLNRLSLIRLIMTDGMIVMKTLQNIVKNRDLVRHADEQCEAKNRMAKVVVLVATTMAFCMMVSCTSFYFIWHLLHMLSSKSALEACCWLFWGMQDMLVAASVAGDVVLFPAMWILIAINYRTDVMKFTLEIEQANVSPDYIVYSYVSLVRQAAEVNRMSSFILFSLVLCTTPFSCTALFAVEHGNSLLISILVLACSAPLVLLVWLLLAIAASITSLSDGLHGRLYKHLCSISGKETLRNRIRLLEVLEQMGSEEQLLAFRTLDGQRYTSVSLLHYLVETVLQYTLLMTFDRYLQLH